VPKVHMLHARLKASLRWLMSSIPPTLHVSVLSSSHLDFCTFRAQPPVVFSCRLPEDRRRSILGHREVHTAAHPR
jgi:hypothetical protein